MAATSEEEENYIRFSLLLTGISPRAVRALFDKEFAPAVLPHTIKKESSKIVSLFNRKVINQTQFDIVRTKSDSQSFDISLMICLLTNLTPIRGYDRPGLPSPTDLSTGADLARIKHYRNVFAHLSDSRVDNSSFVTAWKVISETVGRLGGSAMVEECTQLRNKVLDQSNKEIILEIKLSREELESLRTSVEALTEETKRNKTKHRSLKRAYDKLSTDTVPWNIREQIKEKLVAWEKDDQMFVETRAAKSVLKNIQDKNCVTVTGSSGVGKSFTVRHVALKMTDYDKIPVTNPDEICNYYDPNRKILFVVDDFCGTYSLIEHDLRNWERKLKDIESLVKNGKVKIIVVCRLQVYQDLLFETLTFFRSCEINLMSSSVCLLWSERLAMADVYLKSHATSVNNYLELYECFPLLCRLFFDNPTSNVVDLFKDPFSVYEAEILKLYNGKSHAKYCALALCVMFNNRLEENWFLTDRIDEINQDIFEATLEVCKLPKGTSKLVIRDELESLTNTFIRKLNVQKRFKNMPAINTYRTIHDKLFDFLVYYFGRAMSECVIKYADFKLISKKFFFHEHDKDIYDVVLPKNCHFIYIDRIINEWYKGDVHAVIKNVNISNQIFRKYLLTSLCKKDKAFQRKLATCKIKKPKAYKFWFPTTKECPLSEFCDLGDRYLIRWCCENVADVNELDVCRKTPLSFACETGDAELVRFLLEKNTNVNLVNKTSCLPLYLASESGYVEIVQTLLKRNAKVCTDKGRGVEITGKSQLYIACRNGHLDVVELLIKDAINRNYCYECEAFLFIACQQGHKQIVKMLLLHENVVKHYPIGYDYESVFYVACIQRDKDMVEILFRSNLLAQYRICYYIEDKTKSPLYVACENGHKEIVRILLGNEAFVKECSRSKQSALYIACMEGKEEIVSLLIENELFLEHHTDRSSVLSNCFNVTKMNKYFKIMEMLLQNHILIKHEPLQILESACENGYTELVCKFLKEQTFVDQCVNNIGREQSNLYKACENDHTDIVKLLLTNEVFRYGIKPEILYLACSKGNVDIVSLLLNENIDINNCQKWGNSSLYIASKNGHTNVVKILLEHNADVNIDKNNGNASLHTASSHGHKEIVDILIQSGADIDMTTSSGETSLHLACVGDHVDVVKELLRKGADINKYTKFGQTSLFISCERGFTSIVDILLQYKADIYKCAEDNRNLGKSPLYIASSFGHTEIVENLLKNGADVNKCAEGPLSAGQSPLFIACVFNHINVVKALLKHGADVNKSVVGSKNKDKFSLSIACEKGYFEIVKLLLQAAGNINKRSQNGATLLHIAQNTNIQHLLIDKGIDVNLATVDGHLPLHYACKYQSTEIVSRLLSYKSNVNKHAKDGTTPLLNACLEKNTNVVKLLLNNGADVNKGLKNGLSPLFRACRSNDTETVKILLERSPDVNKAIRGGRSPLHEASDRGNADIVRLLLQHKAKVNYYTKYKRTPLFFACQKGHIDIVEMLIENHADINVTPSDGKTALFVACGYGHTKIVEMLLNKRADYNIRSEWDLSPLDIAMQYGRTEVIELLKQKINS